VPESAAAAFLLALEPVQRTAWDASELAVALEQTWERAVSIRGDYGVDVESFASHLARRTEGPPLLAAEAGDLLLAFACMQGRAAALRRFDAELGPVVDKVGRTARLDLEPAAFRQRVYERVLVSDGDGPPRIAAYRGAGPVRAWLRMVASRLAVDERRRARPPEQPLPEAVLGHAPHGELELLAADVRPSFRAAFRRTIEVLQPQERAILRLRYLHGLSVTELAKMQGVHRVTMSRNLTALRQRLLSGIVAAIAHSDGLTPREAEDVLRQVRSRLDMTLSVLEY
jgi:RNA polymerase sigma-70 factor (ECF subfamily)